MKIKEVRELSNEEIVARRREARQDLLHLNVQKASGQVENLGRFRQIRRDVARLETILSERRLNLAVGKKGENKAPAAAPAEQPAAKKAAKKSTAKKAAKKAAE